ncbi:MAG TPA: zinc ribbon domain-containing protein [Patescibacteria group bacterium]|nr:zinc ribbon domain-containing protein [Patescibacteria group bacterium]
MPIYEYVCQDCQTSFEHLVLGKNGAISCPKCGSRQATLQLSVFAAPHGEDSSADAGPSCGCSGGGCGCHN